MAITTSVVLFDPMDTSPEVRTLAGFLAGFSGRTREAYRSARSRLPRRRTGRTRPRLKAGVQSSLGPGQAPRARVRTARCGSGLPRDTSSLAQLARTGHPNRLGPRDTVHCPQGDSARTERSRGSSMGVGHLNAAGFDRDVAATLYLNVQLLMTNVDSADRLARSSRDSPDD
jgi:hypothetical protein